MQFLNFNSSANAVQFLSFISIVTEYLHPDTFGRTFLLEERQFFTYLASLLTPGFLILSLAVYLKLNIDDLLL
jgi:hypothetical protein